MAQKFKTVYFSDFPAEHSNQKNLTLAFGKKDQNIFDCVNAYSSHEMRETLGYPTFQSLERAANDDGLSVGTFCFRLLRLKYRTDDGPNACNHDSLADTIGNRELALQGTFKGGADEPLHDWFSYLEGYSPKFVTHILTEFCPDAERVLDPFAGTGTTPLTIAQLGRRSFYSELNPVLQFMVESKVSALSLPDKDRERTAEILRRLGEHLTKLIENISPAWDLEYSHKKVFRNSSYFEPANLTQVLRIRNLIDLTACTDPLTARFLTVAALASLIKASNSIRRGDLRFKTKSELSRGTPAYLDLVADRLFKMSDDIRSVEQIEQAPLLLTENAKHWSKIPVGNFDAVITSPPYLNGTNYFRNTKLELWFLRCLVTENDLAGFRFKAVTAGINDVTVQRSPVDLDKNVKELVDALSEDSYDRRIPQMAANYFADMKLVFGAIRKHLSDGATVAIDIGDSTYSIRT